LTKHTALNVAAAAAAAACNACKSMIEVSFTQPFLLVQSFSAAAAMLLLLTTVPGSA
jgi:hypothetical protein